MAGSISEALKRIDRRETPVCLILRVERRFEAEADGRIKLPQSLDSMKNVRAECAPMGGLKLPSSRECYSGAVGWAA